MNVAANPVDRVGIRELKNQLSRYVSLARSGHEVVVTNHGRAVAKLVPLQARAGILDDLVARGEATAPRRARRQVPRPIASRGSVSDLVAHQRR